jgi:hypothetical protein
MLYALANKYITCAWSKMRPKPWGPAGMVSASAHAGDFVSFSFQANKNITSSEGGCLVLNNAEEARLAEKYRLQGVTRSGFDGLDVDVLGGKFNMTDIAAAIGLGQFAHIENHHRPSSERWPRHYFECFGSGFRGPIRRATAGGGLRTTATGTCSSWCCRSARTACLPARRSWRRCRPTGCGHRLPLPADPPAEPVSGTGLSRKGCSRWPNVSGA